MGSATQPLHSAELQLHLLDITAGGRSSSQGWTSHPSAGGRAASDARAQQSTWAPRESLWLQTTNERDITGRETCSLTAHLYYKAACFTNKQWEETWRKTLLLFWSQVCRYIESICEPMRCLKIAASCCFTLSRHPTGHSTDLSAKVKRKNYFRHFRWKRQHSAEWPALQARWQCVKTPTRKWSWQHSCVKSPTVSVSMSWSDVLVAVQILVCDEPAVCTSSGCFQNSCRRIWHTVKNNGEVQDIWQMQEMKVKKRKKAGHEWYG